MTPRPSADFLAWSEEIALEAPTGMVVVIPHISDEWMDWVKAWGDANVSIFDVPDIEDYPDFLGWSEAFSQANP